MIKIVSARFANPLHDAGLIVTDDKGEILVDPSQVDLWQDFISADPSPFAYAQDDRSCTQNQWITAVGSFGKLDDWLSLISDETVKSKDRAYLITGGDTGRYLESSAKLARLANKAGLDVKATFDVIAIV